LAFKAEMVLSDPISMVIVPLGALRMKIGKSFFSTSSFDGSIGLFFFIMEKTKAPMPITAVVMTMELPVMADVAVMVATDVLPAALLPGLGVAAKSPAG
jgi:hypothetical protein